MARRRAVAAPRIGLVIVLAFYPGAR